MNSWHTWDNNSKWVIFSSKYQPPYTKMLLTHIDDDGNDSIPLVLWHLSKPNLASNVPEFINLKPNEFKEINIPVKKIPRPWHRMCLKYHARQEIPSASYLKYDTYADFYKDHPDEYQLLLENNEKRKKNNRSIYEINLNEKINK